MQENSFQDDRYLCNDFPNMEKGYSLYNFIKNKEPIDKHDLEKNMHFEIKQSFRTLDIAGLLRHEGKGVYIKRFPAFINELNVKESIKYKMFFLNSLRKKTLKKNNFWSNQAHVLLQHRIMVEKSIRYFDVRKVIIINTLNSELNKKNYRPTNKGDNEIKLNDKKLRYWKYVCDFLGLTSPGSTLYESSLTLNPKIFKNLIKCYFDNSNKKECNFNDLINFLNEKFLLIPIDKSDSPPNIYEAYSEILYFLHFEKIITLKQEGDAPIYRLDGIRKRNDYINRVVYND